MHGKSEGEELTLATNSDIPLGPLLDAIFAKDGGNRSDGALLQQYVELRDERAFAALVRRHGPMVLGVCHRVLGNLADAEDAFQATFFILIRKAPSLTGRATVGDWLHGVARRIALKAKAAAARRRAKEQCAARPVAQSAEPRSDWLPRLDQELARLPTNYRLPIVLCDLEGKTRRQAARQLGWPEGTVAGRLARARALLAKRLLGGAQVLMGTLLTGSTAHAGLPSRLFHSTIQTAAQAAAGEKAVGTALSAAALALAKGVMRSMVFSKIKIISCALITVAVLGGVGGMTVQILPAREQPSQAIGGESEPKQDAKGQSVEDKRKSAAKLLKDYEEELRKDREKTMVDLRRAIEMEKAARLIWEEAWKWFEAGKTTAEQLPIWSANWMKAQLKLVKAKSDIITAYQDHLIRMQTMKEVTDRRFDAGATSEQQHQIGIYYVLEAEIWLEEAKAGAVGAAEAGAGQSTPAKDGGDAGKERSADGGVKK